MRTTHPIGAVLLLAWAIAGSTCASAEVIVDDALIRPLPPFTDLELYLSKSTGRFGLFSIRIETLSGAQYRFSYAGVAETYALYPVTSGTTIDPAFAASTVPLVRNDNNPGSALLSFAAGQSRLFAYWDDRTMFSDLLPSAADNYGWVEITNSPQGGLTVTSSATAIGGGIIAGTTTQVPEPTSATVVAIGAALGLAVRTRSHRGD